MGTQWTLKWIKWQWLRSKTKVLRVWDRGRGRACSMSRVRMQVSSLDLLLLYSPLLWDCLNSLHESRLHCFWPSQTCHSISVISLLWPSQLLGPTVWIGILRCFVGFMALHFIFSSYLPRQVIAGSLARATYAKLSILATSFPCLG